MASIKWLNSSNKEQFPNFLSKTQKGGVQGDDKKEKRGKENQVGQKMQKWPISPVNTKARHINPSTSYRHTVHIDDSNQPSATLKQLCMCV